MYIERNERKPFRLATAGLQTGVCTIIADIGTQIKSWNGQEKKKRTLIFGWELPEEDRLEDGRPLLITNEYTNVFGDKSRLVLDLQSWTGDPIGEDFDVSSMLGRACNLNITAKTGDNGKSYRNVTGITPLKRNEVSPAAHGALLLFDLRQFQKHIFDELPPFIKKKIEASPEYELIKNPTNKFAQFTGDAELNDIPFGD